MEYLDILDSNGQPTGRKGTKDLVKQGGHWHRVVNLWILDRENRVLQMKRSPQLTYFPGFWSTIGGHVQAGEDSLSAVIRETEEELGLVLGPGDLRYIFTDKATYPWKDKTLRVFRDVYSTCWTGSLEQLCPDPREVAELSWFTLEDLQNWYTEGHVEVFPLSAHYQEKLWQGLTP